VGTFGRWLPGAPTSGDHSDQLWSGSAVCPARTAPVTFVPCGQSPNSWTMPNRELMPVSNGTVKNSPVLA
jgi:hypothetical protein